MNSFGIYTNSYNLIIQTLEKFENISQAIIFGSRAIGNYKKGSDIDISVFGSNITHDEIAHISEILNEELPIPYFIDVVHFETINNSDLKEHILSEGKYLYKKINPGSLCKNC